MIRVPACPGVPRAPPGLCQLACAGLVAPVVGPGVAGESIIWAPSPRTSSGYTDELLLYNITSHGNNSCFVSRMVFSI